MYHQQEFFFQKKNQEGHHHRKCLPHFSAESRPLMYTKRQKKITNWKLFWGEQVSFFFFFESKKSKNSPIIFHKSLFNLNIHNHGSDYKWILAVFRTNSHWFFTGWYVRRTDNPNSHKYYIPKRKLQSFAHRCHGCFRRTTNWRWQHHFQNKIITERDTYNGIYKKNQLENHNTIYCSIIWKKIRTG